MTETMTRLEELQSIHWDMHKDAYGFRPRGMDTSGWTEAVFEAEFEVLGRAIEEAAASCKASEAAAVVRFENQIQSTIASGAGTREDAIRWMHEAEGTGGDADYLCWTLGLPYRYFK